MVLTKTPICDFGKKANKFQLKSTNNDLVTLDGYKGSKGTLIMFICNHCPYVKAIIKNLVDDCKNLKREGINSIAIMSNDTKNYPEDSFENMVKFANEYNFEDLIYCIDETQEIAKKYGAVCTPDIYGFNNKNLLSYRGRIDSAVMKSNNTKIDRELYNAMLKIKNEQKGPKKQFNSFGCSIKWKLNER